MSSGGLTSGIPLPKRLALPKREAQATEPLAGRDKQDAEARTRCIHVGEGIDGETRAIRRPITMTNSPVYGIPKEEMPRYGVEVSFVDASNVEAMKEAVWPTTKAIRAAFGWSRTTRAGSDAERVSA